MKFHQIHLRIDDDTYEEIKTISNKSGDSYAETIRSLIKIGLARNYVDESGNMIANLVRKQVDIAMIPHVERLASISSKAGHMSATSTFLNAQALMDLVPSERRRDIKVMYENARKRSVDYMRTKTSEFDTDFK